jgi:hypothetical protein
MKSKTCDIAGRLKKIMVSVLTAAFIAVPIGCGKKAPPVPPNPPAAASEESKTIIQTQVKQPSVSRKNDSI